MRKIPIGLSDFKILIEEDYYYIDKSLLIKEIIEDGSRIILLPRPRRFGKTLNMTMLKYFFEYSQQDTSQIFKDLNIYDYKNIMIHQGKYPVIYVTLKDLKNANWDECFEGIRSIISELYRKYVYLLDDNFLDNDEKKYYEEIKSGRGTKNQYELSLERLTAHLFRFHQKRVIVLIDEYDMPIISGYTEKYYKEIVGFMRNFLGSVLKDNEYLEKAVLTGILRVAKESIFSGLNNLNIYTILNNKYSEFFGILENEVYKTLKSFNIEDQMSDVKNWYNGYVFGKNIIYNPWSILNRIDKSDENFRPYWINTSSNDVIKDIITRSSYELKRELEILLKGEILEKEINENIILEDIENSTSSIWSFLLFSGYLKVVEQRLEEDKIYCTLKIPNIEVRSLYRQIIESWFSRSITNDKFELMLKSLLEGDIKIFGKILKEFVFKTISYFDVGKSESERVYHAFVLGLLISLNNKYEVKSNKESGYGRYDVMLIPKDINMNGFVFEFKKVDIDEGEDLEICAELALAQIKEKKYSQELFDRDLKFVYEIGIAFSGKDILVKNKKLCNLN